MTEIDLEAIEARALEVITDIDHELVPKGVSAQLAYDSDELLDEVRRLRARLTITDEMVERAAKEYAAHIIVGNWGYLTDLTRGAFRADARRILEAALGEDA